MKGIVPLLIGLGILFLAEVLIFSFAFNKVTIFNRHIIESDILSESTKAETYIRSFLASMQLSLLQSIYDVNLETEKTGDLLSDNQIVEIIKKNSVDYIKNFVDAYKNYPNNDVIFPDKSKIILKDLNIQNDFIKITLEKITFSASNDKVFLKREIVPEVKIDTVFKRIIDASRSFTDDIKKAVDEALSSTTGESASGSKEGSCGGSPSIDSVLQNAVNGKYSSISQAEDAIKTAIENNLNTLLTSEMYNNQFINLEYLESSADGEVQPPSCRESSTTCCKERVPITLECIEEDKEHTRSCDFTFSGSATIKTQIQENEKFYPEYAVWNGKKTILDRIKLIFTTTYQG